MAVPVEPRSKGVDSPGVSGVRRADAGGALGLLPHRGGGRGFPPRGAAGGPPRAGGNASGGFGVGAGGGAAKRQEMGEERAGDGSCERQTF